MHCFNDHDQANDEILINQLESEKGESKQVTPISSKMSPSSNSQIDDNSYYRENLPKSDITSQHKWLGY